MNFGMTPSRAAFLFGAISTGTCMLLQLISLLMPAAVPVIGAVTIVAAGICLLCLAWVGSEPLVRRRLWRDPWTTLARPATLAGLGAGFLLIGGQANAPTWLTASLIVAGLLQFAAAALDLLPLHRGRFTTSGGCLHVARSGQSIAATPAVIAADLGEIPPGNWDSAVVAELEEALAQTGELSRDQLAVACRAGSLLYYHYADRQEWPEATYVLTRALELRSQPEWLGSGFDTIDLMQSLHLALRGCNPSAARIYLERAGGRRAPRSSLVSGAEAAILLREDDPELAVHAAQQARRAPLAIVGEGIAAVEESWWGEIIELAEEMLSATDATAPNIAYVSELHPAHGDEPAVILVSFATVGAWDPGVPSDRRAIWLWRNPATADLVA